MTILGVMSGSSLDGLDLAIVQFSLDGNSVQSWKLVDTRAIPFDKAWQDRLRYLPASSVYSLLETDADLGTYLGEACSEFIKQTGAQVDYIASHGHTVIHAPDKGYTMQIGSGAHIAAITGCMTLTNFRSTDVVHGGQGAPLSPIAEKHLFPGHTFYLNLGGIANLSFSDGHEIKAWDVCPASQLLNHLAQKGGETFDRDGAMAASGNTLSHLLDGLVRITKLPQREPASLDNSFVRQNYLQLMDTLGAPPADLLATACSFIAASVATQVADQNYDPGATMLVTGGSAYNSHLIKTMQDALEPLEVRVEIPTNEIVEFKEAILMALCGALRVAGVPNALASVTGASKDTVNGVLHFA
jgi:anhydro-N-acetylmuramic acid kinase